MSPSPEYVELKIVTKKERERVELMELRMTVETFLDNLTNRESAKRGIEPNRVFVRAFIFDRLSKSRGQCASVVLSDGAHLWAVGGTNLKNSYEVVENNDTLTVYWGGSAYRVDYMPCCSCYAVLSAEEDELVLEDKDRNESPFGAIFGSFESVLNSSLVPGFANTNRELRAARAVIYGLERSGERKLSELS